ncbi:MAG: hypothetical protein A2284_04440 [Deltaproteobacteria bacterium RIFOXYA12_FULL_61_11]|nr:MAG: hypothetical protein A2284_04440 [Deltaproteobacteria bacterium RIFOXYA12_FULL_61_11]
MGIEEWENEKTIIVSSEQAKVGRTLRKKAKPSLIFLSGRMTGRILIVENPKVSLGRDAENDIPIDDPTVSRVHAWIEQVEDGYILRDNNSTNGTFVNDRRLDDTPCALVEGDRLRFGTSQYVKYSFQDELEENFQRQLYENATRDFLTQINNKRFFMERLDSEMTFATRHGSIFSLLMMDVDHFKKVNDTHGHPAGDYVLKTLAAGIKKIIRQEDCFARYGGEEFVMLLRGIEETKAHQFSDRVRRAIEGHSFVHEGTSIPVTISIGVATQCAGRYQDASAVLKAADDYLYKAKQGGRNRVCSSLNCPAG